MLDVKERGAIRNRVVEGSTGHNSVEAFMNTYFAGGWRRYIPVMVRNTYYLYQRGTSIKTSIVARRLDGRVARAGPKNSRKIYDTMVCTKYVLGIYRIDLVEVVSVW